MASQSSWQAKPSYSYCLTATTSHLHPFTTSDSDSKKPITGKPESILAVRKSKMPQHATISRNTILVFLLILVKDHFQHHSAGGMVWPQAKHMLSVQIQREVGFSKNLKRALPVTQLEFYREPSEITFWKSMHVSSKTLLRKEDVLTITSISHRFFRFRCQHPRKCSTSSHFEECPTQCLCHKGFEPLEKHQVSPRHEGLVPHCQWPSKRHPTVATCCHMSSHCTFT